MTIYDTKISKKGQITIPKYIRERFGLVAGISFFVAEKEGEIIVKPVRICPTCKKALPDELIRRGSCLDCPLPEIMQIY